MSSHHIVRDEQEPALLVASPCVYTEIIGQLLEWSPVVVVALPALDHTLAWGCKIDVAICEFSLRQEVELQLFDQIPYLLWHPLGKENFISCALRSLQEAGHQAVNIVGENCLKEYKDVLKHWLSKLDIVIYENELRWRMLPQGKFEKWLPKGAKLQLLEEAEIVKSANIKLLSSTLLEVVEDGMTQLEVAHNVWLGE